MRIAIWNVNGLRSCAQKGLLSWLRRTKPDVVGLQEIRATEVDLPDEVRRLRAYKGHWFPSERPGYSGVGLLCRVPPLAVQHGLGNPDFDREGRVQIAEFEEFFFLNAYFPNGKGKDRDNSRVPFKLAFYDALLARAGELRSRGKGVVIGGDFNTAHTELDLRNWRENRTTSGFLDEERAWIDRYLGAGFKDVHRDRNPGKEGLYTWWSQRQGARERNVGWRIDYFLASDDLAGRIRDSWIEARVLGSDHCPVGLELSPPSSTPPPRSHPSRRRTRP